MSTNQTIPAEQLVIVMPKIEVWSGSIKLDRATDLPQVNGQLPPKGLVTDGRKRLISNLPLLDMLNVRKRIERATRAEGFTLVGTGVAMTAAKAEVLLQEMPQFERAFIEAREGLINHLPQHYADQEALYPSWAGMLRSARLSADEVRSRCRFNVAVFRMAAPDANPASKANELYAQMTSQVLPTLLEDVAADATQLLARFKGKPCVKQTQLTAVKRLVHKLLEFSFLDPRVQPVAAGLESLLDALPVTGALDAPQTACCVAVLQSLMNPALIIAHGTGVIANITAPAVATQHELDVDIDQEPVPPTAAIGAAHPTKRRGFAVAL